MLSAGAHMHIYVRINNDSAHDFRRIVMKTIAQATNPWWILVVKVVFLLIKLDRRGRHDGRDRVLVNQLRLTVAAQKNNRTALVAALQAGNIAGAGIDVFEQEPPAPDNPLMKFDNVVLSPHVAGVTEDSLRGMAMNVADVIDNVFAGRQPATLLNAQVWERRK